MRKVPKGATYNKTIKTGDPVPKWCATRPTRLEYALKLTRAWQIRNNPDRQMMLELIKRTEPEDGLVHITNKDLMDLQASMLRNIKSTLRRLAEFGCIEMVEESDIIAGTNVIRVVW